MRRRPRHLGATTAVRAQRAERRYLRAAAIGAVLLVIGGYAAFVKHLPFGSSFVMRGVFAGSGEVQPGNPVRIAGLAIGSVSGVAPGPDHTAIVTMNIDQPGELRSDASLAVEPRLLFEGNFYVDVNPGTPAAPAMRSGALVPLSRTTIPVQIDQVLDVLDQPTRAALTSTIQVLAEALGPSGADSTLGAGYQGLRTAIGQLNATLPSLTAVAAAAQGTSAGDLPRAVDSTRDLTSELAAHPAALSDLITSDARVFGALSANTEALSRSVAELDQVMKVAPPTFIALDRALPSLTTFATRLRPTLTAAPGALTPTNALLDQIDELTAPRALPQLLPALGDVTSRLPTVETELRQLFPQVSALTGCTTHAIVPALDEVMQDGSNTTGQPAWQELLHMTAGLAGASEAFDGNGSAIRLGVTEGATALTALVPSLGEVASSFDGEGVRPVWLGHGILPDFRPDASCLIQPLANVNLPGNSAGYPLKPTRLRATGGLTETMEEALFGTPAQRAQARAHLLGPASTAASRAPAPVNPAPPTPQPKSNPTSSGTTPPTSTTPTSTPTPALPLPPVAQPILSGVGQALKGLVGGILGGKGLGK